MTSQLIVSGLALGSIYALLALSLVYPKSQEAGGIDRYMGLGVTEYAPRRMSAEETRGAVCERLASRPHAEAPVHAYTPLPAAVTTSID
jgi:hypothetical protein